MFGNLRFTGLIILFFAVASGPLMASSSTTTAVTLNFNCAGTYSLSGTTGTLGGSCNGGTLSPYGTTSLSVAVTATYTEPGGTPTYSNVQGTFSFSISSGGTFQATYASASATAATGGGGVTISGTAPLTAGTGVFQGASGSLTINVSGLSAAGGTGQMTITGSGSITTTGLPAPAGPGTLGNPTATNGMSCGDPVTVSNGNVYHQFQDMWLAGRGLPILILRTYNSQAAATDSPFGFGWTHSYLRYLVINGNTVVYVGESGGAYTFTNSGTSYVSASGLDATLTAGSGGYVLTERAGPVTSFDSTGRMTSLADPNGNAQTMAYDSAGRLQSISDAVGGQVQFTYDASNHITRINDQTGRQATFQYDASGNLVASTDLADNQTTYAYSSASGQTHYMQQIVFPGGGTNSFVYDSAGRLSKLTDQGGGVTQIAYGNGTTTLTDARGHTSTFSFNASGNITSIARDDGSSLAQTWNSGARLATRTDELGFVTKFSYDSLSRMSSKTDPLGNVTGIVYDAVSGKIATFTDPASGVVQNEYDAKGNLLQTADPVGGQTKRTYDGYGQPLTVTDAAGRTTTYSFDALGNPVTISDAIGTLAKASYDALHRIVGSTGPTGQEQQFQYDALGRQIQKTDPVLGVTSSRWDAAGNLASVTGPGSASTSFGYDALANLTQVTDALGGITSYEYKPSDCNCSVAGLLTAAHDARGQITRFTYDSQGRIITATDPLGNTRHYAWNGRGDLTSVTDENGNTTQYQYDGARRLIRETYPDGSAQRYTWDANGNLLTAVNANVTLTFTYDAAGRTTSVRDSRGPFTVSYVYNAVGQRTSMTALNGAVTQYSYDAAGRVAQIVAPGGQTFSFTYGPDRNRSSLALPNGLTAQYTYDGASRPTSLRYLTGAGATVAQFTTTYDADGNRATIADLSGTHRFQYDKLRRLADATHPAAAEEVYSYDAAGNRTGAVNATYDAASRLLSYGGVQFTYDHNGNVTTRTDASGTTTYAYDYSDRLKSAKLPDGTLVEYLYDPFGRRIEKKVSVSTERTAGHVSTGKRAGAAPAGTRAGNSSIIYVYDGDRLLFEQDRTGSPWLLVQYTYRPGSEELLAEQVGNDMYCYLGNGKGDVAGLADASGAVAQTYSYSAFGQASASGNAIHNSHLFAGRPFDVETGLYGFGARAYDPATGRFLQKDPQSIEALQSRQPEGQLTASRAGQTLLSQLRNPSQAHPYAYAGNNPLSFADAGGLQTEDATDQTGGPDEDQGWDLLQMLQQAQGLQESAQGLNALMTMLNQLSAETDALVAAMNAEIQQTGDSEGGNPQEGGQCSAGSGTDTQELLPLLPQSSAEQLHAMGLTSTNNPLDVLVAKEAMENKVEALDISDKLRQYLTTAINNVYK